MKNFATKSPLFFSLLVILVSVVGLKLSMPLLRPFLAEFPARLLVAAGFCVFVIAVVSALGWWKEIGFNGPKNWRGYLAYAPWLLLPLLVVLGSGVHTASVQRVLAFAAFTLMVGFAEDVLLRGVVLRALMSAA